MWFNHRVMCPKEEDGMANNVDPETAPSLIWVYTICVDLSVQTSRIIIVPETERSRLMTKETK